MLQEMSETTISPMNANILDSMRKGIWGNDVPFQEWLKGNDGNRKTLEEIFEERAAAKALEKAVEPNPYEEIPFEDNPDKKY